jgi:tRNA/rRNA methyltransferase
METALAKIKIILVEPAGALNLGSIARVMKNMGLQQLVLVNPQCDPLGAEARQMAVHAPEILEAAQQVMTLAEALRGCRRAIATTGRDRNTLNITLESPKSALFWLLEDSVASEQPTSALIFGREDRGLSNEELNQAQRFIRIPSSPNYPSLNLAQAVAICCYELYARAIETEPQATQQLPSPLYPLSPPPNSSFDLAPLDALEGYYQQLEALLLEIGYLHPHTAARRMEKYRRVLNRAYPSTAEVALLRGMVSQVEWALQARSKQSKAEE